MQGAIVLLILYRTAVGAVLRGVRLAAGRLPNKYFSTRCCAGCDKIRDSKIVAIAVGRDLGPSRDET